MENDTREAKVRDRFDVTLYFLTKNPHKTRKQCRYELVVHRLLEPKCPDIWRQSPKTNCFTHRLLLPQNSSIDNYCNKIDTSCQKIIVQILFVQKVYINSEWLLNINDKSIPTLSHGLKGGKDWLSGFCLFIPQLTVNLGCYAQGSELPKMFFLLDQRYTNLAWAWGKGDNPKGSEQTKIVCNCSCQQKRFQC